MTYSLAQAVFLMSIVKPLLVLIFFGGWAWVVSALDKDAGFYYLKRHLFNLVQLVAGAVALLLILSVPIFWIGLPLGLMFMAGGILGYAYYRNPQVPEGERWSFSLDSFRQRQEERQQAAAQRKATLTIFAPNGERLPIPAPGDEDLHQYMVLDTIMAFALPRNANQIDLSVDAQQAKYRVHIDGVRYPQEAPESAEAVKFIDYLKKLAGLDLEDRRKKQEAHFRVQVEGFGGKDVHLISAGSTRGLQVQINIDPEKTSNIPLKHLGLLPNQMEAIQEVVHAKGKVVLVAGAPKQGVTTTLYSLLQEHDPYTSSVVTLEEEVMFELEGVDHNTLPIGKAANEFNQKLGAMLRSDPNVMMVSRLADAETAKLLAENAQEVRCYVPMQQVDALSALKIWMKTVSDNKLVGQTLGCITAQRLVRRLCPTCRVAYAPDPSAIRKLNLPPDRVGELYRASGKVAMKDKEIPCPDCHGLGYRGRVGVFEVMPIDAQAAKYIASNEIDALRLHMRKQKLLYLQESALAKVVDGTTDIKEVTRVMAK